MKLRAITLNNVRRFTTPVTTGEIGDGLNLLCEPNEHGKSTLFDAVQALFFAPHRTNDKAIKALRPHAGGAPEVSVDVETAEGRFTIAKRWTARPEATVTRDGRLVAQADAAEDWIARLLGGGAGGPSGLVWVRQGVTGLAGGSTREQTAAFEARRDLFTSVSEEVEAMTGGRRMDLALTRCKAELAVFATATLQKRTGGPWKEAADRVDDLTRRKADLARTADALHDALDQRKRKRRDLQALEAPEAVAARRQRLDAAQAAHDAATRHAEAIATEARKVEAARLAVAAARRDLDTLRAALAEQAAAADAAVNAQGGAQAAAQAHDTASEALVAAQGQLDAAQSALGTAEETRRRAARQQAARAGAERRAELGARIAAAEAARQAMEDAAAGATVGPDPTALRRLESLAAAVTTAQAAQDAMATRLRVTYLPVAAPRVRMNGEALADATFYPIPHGARLEVEGMGMIEVRPGAQALDEAAVATATVALRKALDGAGLADLDAARAAADLRGQAARLHGEAKARLAALAPQGIEALREALALIPAAEAADPGLDLPDAEAALEQASGARIAAQARRDAAAEALSAAREAVAGAGATLAGAQDRQRRAEAALAAAAVQDADALESAMTRATTALRAAEALHAEQARHAPDLAGVAAALHRARAIDDTARAEIARLRPEIATLDERIARGAGEAVEERLAECTQELVAAEAGLARITHEVAVLRRLDSALEEARKAARERYFAPVAAELRPLLQLLWPDAELTWGHDTLLPEALIRGGQTEPVDVLSGGTQEQVALLVRLAFARMLARDGRHAPVLLDDALVFTDDDRIERMFDALHRQAGDLQIVVLSCRQRAFRDLGGRILRLAPAQSPLRGKVDAA